MKRSRFDGENQLTRRGELALVRQFDLNDISALALQHRNGFVENTRHLRIEIVNIKSGRHADRETLDRLPRRRHVIRHRPGDRGGVFRVRARHQSQQQRAILDRARQRPDGVERLRQWHCTGTADPAIGRFQSGHATEMRGHPDRAAGIRAQRRKRQPCRDRRARSR